AYADYIGFILTLNEGVKGKKLTFEYKVSEDGWGKRRFLLEPVVRDAQLYSVGQECHGGRLIKGEVCNYPSKFLTAKSLPCLRLRFLGHLGLTGASWGQHDCAIHCKPPLLHGLGLTCAYQPFLVLHKARLCQRSHISARQLYAILALCFSQV
ncbi:hypothetical protein H8959_012611, partial [Pygathrix nigripes]